MADFMQKKFYITKLATSITIVSTLLVTASCSTVSVDKKSASQTIASNRGNIVTKNSLSNKSTSQLMSMGMPADECMDNFEECLNKADNGFLNKHKNGKDYLALFAELHLAKAKDIAQSEDCVETIVRPPIDPYYANAPQTKEERARSSLYLAQCSNAYREHLLSAIKYSYAYLFYKQLNSDTADNKTEFTAVRPTHLPTDLDIQTQDVYEDASDSLIKQLYSSKDRSQQVRHMTSFLSPELIKDANTSMINGLDHANGMKYGQQIKVLNFTFPPVNKDPYFKNVADKAELKALTNPSEDSMEPSAEFTGSENTEEKSGFSQRHLSSEPTSIDLYLPNEPEYLQNTEKYNQSIDKLYASHDLSFSGLNTISARDGFGISYVTLFDDRLNTSVKGLITSDNKKLNSEDPKDRIHLTGNLLLTGTVIPEGTTLQQVLDSHNFDIKLYNPHHTKTVNILGEPYYLAANFSASYGMWLAENNMDNTGYFNLLSKQQNLIMPQLFMLEPYNPDKRIIIMLHGLASSPATWVSITNDIANDDKLRENYQVWQIFYPTNIPMLENRYRIQELIETAYKINDPNSQHIASHDSVLIGHSMGAVIGRMLVSNDNLRNNFNRLAQDESSLRLRKLLNNELDKQRLLNRLQLKKLDSVDTAVFISAPFRGTDFTDRWFTRLLRRMVNLPLGFIQTITGNLANIATEGELASNPLGALYFQNGASQLSDKSSFMKLTADLKIADGVTYHSIIANQDSDLYNGLMRLKITTAPKTSLSDTPAPEQLSAGIDMQAIEKSESADGKMQEMKQLTNDIAQTVTPAISDGIVPYSSSHLEGAASETIIKGGHSIQDTPEAVITLRKILHQHLEDHPLPNQE